MKPFILIETLKRWNVSARKLLLYEATECLADFVVHAEGIALDSEAPTHRHAPEVQTQAAVGAEQRLYEGQ